MALKVINEMGFSIGKDDYKTILKYLQDHKGKGSLNKVKSLHKPSGLLGELELHVKKLRSQLNANTLREK